MLKTLRISSVFGENSSIPTFYSCEGKNVNPTLVIGNIPKDTVSLALIMEDSDVATGIFIHWIAWNINPGDIPEDSSSKGIYQEGLNSAGKQGYIGPCPPIGHGLHHYYFKIYALDESLNLHLTTKREELIKAMDLHILGWGELIGLYERK